MPFNYKYPGGPFAIVYAIANVPANQTSVNIPVDAAVPNAWRTYLGRPYQIRGIAMRLHNGPLSAGSLFLRPTIGGIEVGSLKPTLNVGDFFTAQWQSEELDVDDGSRSVGLTITTTASYAVVSGNDLTATLFVELLNG